MMPRNGPHGEGGSSGPETGHLMGWSISGKSYGDATTAVVARIFDGH
jgi:hypothetical protein